MFLLLDWFDDHAYAFIVITLCCLLVGCVVCKIWFDVLSFAF